MHMQEQFGHVTVTYDEETALLQQPRPEDLLVEQLLEEGFDCKRAQAPSFPVLYHLSQLRGNLTEWLPVKMTDTVLEFGADSGQLTGGLAKKAEKVICLEESVSRCRLLAKRWQTVDNISVIWWKCVDNAGNPSEIRLDCGPGCADGSTFGILPENIRNNRR